MVKGGKQQLKPTAAEGGYRPAAAEKSSSSSEQPMIEEGLYELEAIRRKRMRKGVPYYLVKWLGYPEAENTWEPRQNLESFCSHVIDSFEKSLKTAKKSSCKRKRKGAASQPKKREQTPPAAAATPSAEPLTRENSLTSSPIEDSLRVEEANPVSDGAVEAGEENNLHLKISELNVSAATNGEQSVIEQGGPENDTLLSGRCIGARRRKSGIVKRFIPQPGASTIDGVQDVSAPNYFCSMATNQGIQNGSSGISKTLDDSSHITELLNMISCTSIIINNNAKDVLIMFTAKRADGTQVPVNNKFLKAYYPHLLIKFYEQHLWCTPHGI